MSAEYQWEFVDGDMPGDGARWLEHPTQRLGYIDFWAPAGPRRRLMVVTRRFMEAQLRDLGSAAKWSVFPEVLIVPDGTPTEVRTVIDDAVRTGTLAATGYGAEIAE